MLEVVCETLTSKYTLPSGSLIMLAGKPLTLFFLSKFRECVSRHGQKLVFYHSTVSTLSMSAIEI